MSKKQQTWLIINASIGIFIAKLDMYIVNISLPVITQYYETDIGVSSLVLIF